MKCPRIRLGLLIAHLMLALGAAAQPATAPQRPDTPVAAAEGASAGLYKSERGPHAVSHVDETWTDPARHREVPVRVYIPGPQADGAGARFPVIVFSHGWGGSRTSYAYLAEHLASHGYLVVLPTHAGSDTASIPLPRVDKSAKDFDTRVEGMLDRLQTRREERRIAGASEPAGAEEPQAEPKAPRRMSLEQSINDPDNLRDRPRDISFVIDQLSEAATTKDLADTNHIGVAGHSFGAYTSMAIGGMTVELPGDAAASFADARVKAIMPISPQGRGTMGIVPGAWAAVRTPVLFLTGTKDYGQGLKAAAWRREAFDAVAGTEKYLVVIDGATHMTFAMPGKHKALINSLATAFFDTHVRGDEAGTRWLDAWAAAKHDEATVEHAGVPVERP